MEYHNKLVINVVKIKASSEESYFFKGLLISSSTYAFMDSGFIILNKTLQNWALVWIDNQTLILQLLVSYIFMEGASPNRLKLIINL